MRKVLSTGVCALLLSASAVSAQAPQKFAMINSGQLMQAAPGSAEAQATLEKELAGFRAQATKMNDSMQTLTAAYQKDLPTLSATAKDARLKVLNDRQTEFQEKIAKLEDQASQRQAEVMQPIIDMVKKVLEDVRMEGGYSFIFDVSAGQFLAAADRNLDITDRVLSRVKLMAAPKAGAAKTTGPAANPAGVTPPKKPPTPPTQ